MNLQQMLILFVWQQNESMWERKRMVVCVCSLPYFMIQQRLIAC